jgi:hypothetical protein
MDKVEPFSKYLVYVILTHLKFHERRISFATGHCEINVGRNEVRQKFYVNIKMTFVVTESS